MITIAEALRGIRRIGVDTAPYIYYVENNPLYAARIDTIFRLAETSGIEIITSTITLTETLMKPIRTGDQALIKIYRELLTETEYVRLIAVTPQLAEKAAYLRAEYNLRTPDAIHIATAIETGCDAFLTNDQGFKRVTELKVLLLDDLEIPGGEF